MMKPNAGASKLAGKVKARTGGKRVKRVGVKQPGAVMTKHGVKGNIPTM